jgi:hypothetical protein
MKQRRELETHQLEAIGKFAELSMKSSFPLNGGLFVAIMTFIGNRASTDYYLFQSIALNS